MDSYDILGVNKDSSDKERYMIAMMYAPRYAIYFDGTQINISGNTEAKYCKISSWVDNSTHTGFKFMIIKKDIEEKTEEGTKKYTGYTFLSLEGNTLYLDVLAGKDAEAQRVIGWTSDEGNKRMIWTLEIRHASDEKLNAVTYEK
jgi:hypothetical protein